MLCNTKSKRGVLEQVELTRRDLFAQVDRYAAQRAAQRSHRERLAYYEKAAISTIETYTKTRTFQPLVSSNPDPYPTNRSIKLSFNLIDFCADVELATEKALAEKPELQKAWFDIALGNDVPLDLRSKVLQTCGRAYAARKIEPWKYWRRRAR
jgi:hypothetical protein